MIKCDRCEDNAWYRGDNGDLCRNHFNVVMFEQKDAEIENLKAQVEMLEGEMAILTKVRELRVSEFSSSEALHEILDYVEACANNTLEKLKQMRGSDE